MTTGFGAEVPLNKKCQVCYQRFPLKFPGTDYPLVASSVLGAVSFSRCRVCLELGAEPVWAVAAVLEMTGGDIADWVHDLQTHLNGRYARVGDVLPEIEALLRG